jgi:serine/threonine-protein kinase
VLAYELIAGRLPFIGKNMIDTLSARLRDEAPPLHALAVKTPRPLSYAIMRAMHREPNKRFASILEFRDALDFVRLPNGLPCAL